MTDYNDSKWHGWNGGECPVHPKSVVEVQFPDRIYYTDVCACDMSWYQPLLFRVTKPYPDPLELWVNVYEGIGGDAFFSMVEAQKSCGAKGRTIHMREVTE